MDVLTDSSLTLIVKTSEPENANAGESTGEAPSSLSLFLKVGLCVRFYTTCLLLGFRKSQQNKKQNHVAAAFVDAGQPTFPTDRQEPPKKQEKTQKYKKLPFANIFLPIF